MYTNKYPSINFTQSNIQIITVMFNAFKFLWMQVQRLHSAVLYRQRLQCQSEAISITHRR